jgi:hypothetical protein
MIEVIGYRFMLGLPGFGQNWLEAEKWAQAGLAAARKRLKWGLDTS